MPGVRRPGATVRVRPVTSADAEVWLRLRRDLWPDGSEQEHRNEIGKFLSGQAREPMAVLIASDLVLSLVSLSSLSDPAPRGAGRIA
jgi:hypothetical protein